MTTTAPLPILTEPAAWQWCRRHRATVQFLDSGECIVVVDGWHAHRADVTDAVAALREWLIGLYGEGEWQ